MPRMLTAPDRRSVARRAPPKLEEPLDRKAERRAGDRRDAPRVPRDVTVIDCANANRQDVSAFLSLEGISWSTPERLQGDAVVVQFRLPDVLEPLRLVSVVNRISKRRGRFQVHARFDKLPIKSALALARFLESRTRMHLALSEL